jgi:uncharacterized membrane protein
MIPLAAVLFLAPSIIIGAIGSLYMKKGAKGFRMDLTLVKNHSMIIGVFLTAVSVILYVYALKYSELSKIYPLVSLNYILIAILSSVFLKEKITMAKAAGIIFITLGCFLTIK